MHSNLALVTPPAILPISVMDAKAQVRLDSSDTNFDTRLYDCVAQATSHLQTVYGNILTPEVWDVWFPCFPCGDFLLPYGPVISLDEFEYTDEDGTTTTVDSDLYGVQSKRPPWLSRVYLKPNQSWPTATLYSRDAVHMRLTLGWANEETVDAAEATTSETSLKMTAHGLIDLDTILNTTRTAQRTARYVDANTLTVESVTSQASGDAIRKFRTSKIPAVFRRAIKEMVGTMFELTDDVLITPAGSALQAMPPWAARTCEPFKVRGV